MALYSERLAMSSDLEQLASASSCFLWKLEVLGRFTPWNLLLKNTEGLPCTEAHIHDKSTGDSGTIILLWRNTAVNQENAVIKWQHIKLPNPISIEKQCKMGKSVRSRFFGVVETNQSFTPVRKVKREGRAELQQKNSVTLKKPAPVSSPKNSKTDYIIENLWLLISLVPVTLWRTSSESFSFIQNTSKDELSTLGTFIENV